jgi:DNA-binding response OmpR family regulator
MRRILIVEDEPHIVMSLEFLLTQRGHDVRVATDGANVMQHIHDFRPDLLLLDVMLPRLSGFDICREVRADETTRDMRVIMLSARGREAEITLGLEAGANAYVTKPFSTVDLMQQVDRMLKR